MCEHFESLNFTTLNINEPNEKLGIRFGGIYPNNIGKNRALNHIKALLSDGNYIIISDSYIDFNHAQWEENKNTLENIIPKKDLDLTIESGSTKNHKPSLSGNRQNELKSIHSGWKIKAKQYNDNSKHDRYIETDKIKILLSSGLYNLSNNSNKDFTYIINLKKGSL